MNDRKALLEKKNVLVIFLELRKENLMNHQICTIQILSRINKNKTKLVHTKMEPQKSRVKKLIQEKRQRI